MNFQFDYSVANRYKSHSQKIRVMSELWLANNVFCPCCGHKYLGKLENNLPVADVFCKNCRKIFELKSKQNHFGSKIIDGAYSTMIERIAGDTNPHLFTLQYSTNLYVTDLIFVPKFFFTPSIIEKRKPLSPNAKRAGWVGCKILYNMIPEQGKIPIIRDGKEYVAEAIVKQYENVAKLRAGNLRARNWLMDVLLCINKITSEIFILKDIYKYTKQLQIKHADNHNVEAKIRQQLQFLRDKGFIEFIGRGVYKKINLRWCILIELNPNIEKRDEIIFGEYDKKAYSGGTRGCW